MEENEGGIFSEAPNPKFLFLVKIKIKQNQTSQIRNTMPSLCPFIKIPGLILEVKNIWIINDWENIFAYWEESKQSDAWANKLGLFQYILGSER